MNRLPMSNAGAALLRALLSRALVYRALVYRDRILLTEYRSTDWQSLTFVGERHEMRFRIAGPNAEEIYRSMTGGLEDAEFSIAKQLLADIAVFGEPEHGPEGSISFGIEALTISDD